ncbi:MAG TPA: RDD family protein [Candidatus Angelobacter sp.]|nr:RDD family protein [Candidatus Angelobacter sp.]
MENEQEFSSPAYVAGKSMDIANPGQTAHEPAWRQEISSRVQQHRARRRKQGDGSALELDFTTEEPYSFIAEPQERALPPRPERFAEIVVKPNVPKVIRFPRPMVAPPPAIEEVRLDELPQPALDVPRILDAPEDEGGFIESDFVEVVEAALPAPAAPAEQMQLLPNFADIHLEPEANRLTDELDGIPHAAPLGQRAVAGAVDAAIVFFASGVFALTFLQLAEETPRSRLTMVCALAVGGVFWLAFQYLFLVYGRRTPGMKLAQLELCTFAGEPAPLFARQARAFAGTLSGFAIGLGYFWAFIDEDRLGWHDRISQTYLRSSLVPSAARKLYGYDDLN